jgi:hypothetical protein
MKTATLTQAMVMCMCMYMPELWVTSLAVDSI